MHPPAGTDAPGGMGTRYVRMRRLSALRRPAAGGPSKPRPASLGSWSPLAATARASPRAHGAIGIKYDQTSSLRVYHAGQGTMQTRSSQAGTRTPPASQHATSVAPPTAGSASTHPQALK